MKSCGRCKEVKDSSEFYKRPDRKDGLQSYCKSCFYDHCKQRWVDNKIKAIDYKGGTCIDCEKRYHPAAMQFHHLNPAEKDVNWTKLRLRSWDKITKELDKCVLLCANCHLIRHSSNYD